jgi:hypothetical protein
VFSQNAAFRAHDIDDNPTADGRPLPTPNAKNRAPIAVAIIDSSHAAHSLNSTVLTRAISRVVLGHPIKAMPTDLLNPKWLMLKTVGSATWVDVPAELGQSLTNITMLSRVVDFFMECSVAVGTMFGRSQQPRPDRFQDLLQRQTRSFFCLKVDGQDEQVCERAQGKVMMKTTPGSSLKDLTK